MVLQDGEKVVWGKVRGKKQPRRWWLSLLLLLLLFSCIKMYCFFLLLLEFGPGEFMTNISCFRLAYDDDDDILHNKHRKAKKRYGIKTLGKEGEIYVKVTTRKMDKKHWNTRTKIRNETEFIFASVYSLSFFLCFQSTGRFFPPTTTLTARDRTTAFIHTGSCTSIHPSLQHSVCVSSVSIFSEGRFC